MVPPASLTQDCPAPREFGGKDMGDLLKYTVGLLGEYHECRARHAGLISYSKGE